MPGVLLIEFQTIDHVRIHFPHAVLSIWLFFNLQIVSTFLAGDGVENASPENNASSDTKYVPTLPQNSNLTRKTASQR